MVELELNEDGSVKTVIIKDKPERNIPEAQRASEETASQETTAEKAAPQETTSEGTSSQKTAAEGTASQETAS